MKEADRIIELLGLEPLPQEGGFYRETYRGPAGTEVPVAGGKRPALTAIFYLITPESYSRLHRVRSDEIFHFYLGDPVDMIQIDDAGALSRHALGISLRAGARPQVLAPGGVWQGSRLVPGGRFALLGTTVSPGFDFADYEHGVPDDLLARFPEHADAMRPYF